MRADADQAGGGVEEPFGDGGAAEGAGRAGGAIGGAVGCAVGGIFGGAADGAGAGAGGPGCAGAADPLGAGADPLGVGADPLGAGAAGRCGGLVVLAPPVVARSVSATSSIEVEVRPWAATSSLKSCGLVATRSASSIETRPAWKWRRRA